jgi:hypothetical protein
VLTALACGCAPAESAPLSASVSFVPAPPAVGASALALDLADADGPLLGARVEIEATMSHPGMVPVLADGREVGAGRYEAALDFTMAGEWILFVRATTHAGAVRSATLDVPYVAPAGAGGAR